MKTKLLMLGDSLTYRNSWHVMLGVPVINRGIDGDTTYGVLYRLEQLNLNEVARVFLMMGINDIAQGEKAADIFDRYEMIIHYFLDRGIEVTIQSTLYVAADFYGYQSFNDEVDTLNALLRDAAARHSLTFIDINSGLSERGALQSRFTLDGVHLNAKAYDVWVQQLKIYM